MFLWFNRFPEEGTPEPEHVGINTCNELYSVMCIYCILLSAFVGWYIEYKKMDGVCNVILKYCYKMLHSTLNCKISDEISRGL